MLSTYFELLSNVYEPDPAGKPLVEWMKEDWRLFTHERMDLAHAKELLGEILDDGEIVRKPFSPSPTYKSEGLLQWETLRDELMYANRWFLNKDIDFDRLSQLLDQLIVQDLPHKWFRARIRTGDEDIQIDQMGAPPKQLATYGRANPAGIPYLYLSSTSETAVSEVRPHTGDLVCVAEFTVPSVRVVDLRDPRKTVSPFILSDASEIGKLLSDLPFLERLGEELTRPVLPKSAAIGYIPSQYLCEFIKTCGFDGVVYRSSVSDAGINLALFSEAKVIGNSVKSFEVTKVKVEVNQY